MSQQHGSTRVWWILALLGTACASSVEPHGHSSALQTGAEAGVPPTPVVVTQLYGKVVAACGAGYAHPNICCHGAAYQATTCTEASARPFGTCDEGQLAYPDPATCCSLDDPTKCAAADVDAGPAPSCNDPCAPGAYPAAPDSGFLCWYGTGSSGESATLFCSLCEGPSPPYCGVPCPAGWSAPAGGQVDACCRRDSGGQTQCFSQATWIASDIGGSGHSDPEGCLFEQSVDDGNSYVMKCTFTGTNTCNCLVNGTVTRTLSSNTCDLTLCGFPPFPVTGPQAP